MFILYCLLVSLHEQLFVVWGVILSLLLWLVWIHALEPVQKLFYLSCPHTVADPWEVPASNKLYLSDYFYLFLSFYTEDDII